jgi:hypothetical protein
MQTELDILLKLRDTTLSREHEIYTNEIDRIKNKQREYHVATKTEYDSNLAEYMKSLSIKQELDTKYSYLKSVIDQGLITQSERQTELFRAIHQKNQIDRNRRNAIINKSAELTRLDTEIAHLNDYINKYDDHRRQIIEDYYNWIEDNEATNLYLDQIKQSIQTNELTNKPINHRIINKHTELENLAVQLATDPRQNQDARIATLDSTINKYRTRAKLLNLRKNVINEQPINNGTETVELPPYFREELQELKAAKREMAEIVPRIASHKQQLDMQLSTLFKLNAIINNPAYLPDDLREQRERAITRLDTVKQRVATDLDVKIQECRDRILEAEKQRLSAIETVTPTIKPAHIHPSVSIPSTPVSTPVSTPNTTKQSRRTNKYINVINGPGFQSQ